MRALLAATMLVSVTACLFDDKGRYKCDPADPSRRDLDCPVADAGGTEDAGTIDAGTPDSGAPDSGTPDSGAPDSGTPDSGTPDSGIPDGGTPDGGSDAGRPVRALRWFSIDPLPAPQAATARRPFDAEALRFCSDAGHCLTGGLNY